MSQLFRDDTGQTVQIIKPCKTAIQNVTVSGASAQTTNTLPNDCSLAVLVSTTNCWFNWSTNPTAAKDNTSIYLPAGVYFYLPITPGQSIKVAFIQDSAGGTAQVIPSL